MDPATIRAARTLLANYREKQDRYLRGIRSGDLYKNQVLTDEDRKYATSNFIGSFTKGLEHNDIGLVALPGIKDEYTLLASAIFNNTELPFVPKQPLVNPVPIYCNFIGAARDVVMTPLPPSVGSLERAYEMAELYAMSTARDIEFTAYASNDIIANAVAKLSAISGAIQHLQRTNDTTKFNRLTIFRGIFKAPLEGSFRSAFWEKFSSSYLYPYSGDYLTTRSETITRQTTVAPIPTVNDDAFSIPRTLRHLAHVVKTESVATVFSKAAAVLDGADARRSGKYTVYDDVDVYSSIGELSKIAMQSTWDLKWRKYRTLRPEAYGIIASFEFESKPLGNGGAFIIPSQIRNDDAYKALIAQNGGILSQCYYNGSDCSPAYPSEVAVCAGALATLLKAKYTSNATFPDSTTTIASEIDKLAWNLAIGQCAAGVNFQSDIIEGISFGERIAVEYLRDTLSITRDPYSKTQVAVRFPSFIGTEIKIVPVDLNEGKPTRSLVVTLILVVVAIVICMAAGAMMWKQGAPKFDGWFYRQ